MFRNWILELILIFISFSTQGALYGEMRLQSGLETASEIERSYQKGEYDGFLQTIDAYYKSAGRMGVIRSIFESVKKGVESKADQLLRKSKAKRGEIAQLKKERNQRLLEAVAQSPNLEIARTIQKMVFQARAFSELTAQRVEILSELAALKFHIPKTSKATIRNKISALETEYYIKSLLLDVGSHLTQGPVHDREKKKMILEMAKLDEMLGVAIAYERQDWIEKIEKTKKALLEEKALAFNDEAFERMGSQLVQPQNSVEENVRQIMMGYLDKRELVLVEPR